MGAANVGAAYLMWSHLADGPFRVLVGMALHSMDDDSARGKARRWFGGEDNLVGFVRQIDSAGKVRTHAARRSAAYRYLDQLREAGAVSVVVAGARNRRAVYAVNVDPMCPTPSDVNVSDAVGREGSDGVGHEGSEPVGPLGTTKEPQRSHHEENITSGDHVESRATSPADAHKIESTGEVWHDVPLVDADDVDAAEFYEAAAAHLARTVGTERGAELAAAYFKTTYTRAVVDAAAAHGWTP